MQQENTISIWVGGDDLADAALAILNGAPKQTVQRSLATYAQNIATLVLAIRKVIRAPIILCTQYNPFPNSPLAVEAVAALNGITEGVSSRLDTLLAPTHAWFTGRQAELIAGYKLGKLKDVLSSPNVPVHPNNRGHIVIAQGLSSIIRRL